MRWIRASKPRVRNDKCIFLASVYTWSTIIVCKFEATKGEIQKDSMISNQYSNLGSMRSLWIPPWVAIINHDHLPPPSKHTLIIGVAYEKEWKIKYEKLDDGETSIKISKVHLKPIQVGLHLYNIWFTSFYFFVLYKMKRVVLFMYLIW